MIRLIRQPIDTQEVLASVATPRAGAAVLFLGVTREFTGERQTLWLDYDGYEPMARKQMESLVEQAHQQWDILHCSMVHRLGRLELEEASLAVAVSSPHRADAFLAATWLIDRLKVEVPIWKQEHWATGESEWVHPGLSNVKEAPNQKSTNCTDVNDSRDPSTGL